MGKNVIVMLLAASGVGSVFVLDVGPIEDVCVKLRSLDEKLGDFEFKEYTEKYFYPREGGCLDADDQEYNRIYYLLRERVMNRMNNEEEYAPYGGRVNYNRHEYDFQNERNCVGEFWRKLSGCRCLKCS